MPPFAPALLLAAFALAPSPAAPREEACVRKVTELPRRPRVDGDLRDLVGATQVLTRPSTEHSAGLRVRAAVFGETLYLGVDVTMEHAGEAPALTLGLHSPEAGVAAPGHLFHVGPDGKRPSTPEE